MREILVCLMLSINKECQLSSPFAAELKRYTITPYVGNRLVNMRLRQGKLSVREFACEFHSLAVESHLPGYPQDSPGVHGNVRYHSETIHFYLIHMPQQPLILGVPWLAMHNPHINWFSGSSYSGVPIVTSPVSSLLLPLPLV